MLELVRSIKMPLYELFCIAVHDAANFRNLQNLMSNVSTQIHSAGGVVRTMRNLGVNQTLPMRMKRNQQFHTHGDQFSIIFDTSPAVLARLNETMRLDPMVIRWTMLKKGTALKDLNPMPPATMQPERGH